MENFSDPVPNTTYFNVGFYGGRQSNKRWLYCQDDFDGMYGTRDGGEITHWCEGKKNGPSHNRDDQPEARKRNSTSRRQEKKDEVDQLLSSE